MKTYYPADAARFLGCSRTAIHDNIRRGKLIVVDGYITEDQLLAIRGTITTRRLKQQPLASREAPKAKENTEK